VLSSSDFIDEIFYLIQFNHDLEGSQIATLLKIVLHLNIKIFSMPKKIILMEQIIINKIHELRGQKVMLDRDLAEIYGVETKRLKEQVNRNIERFPSNFMFTLTNDEIDYLLEQKILTSKHAIGGYSPFAFTEHGVLMLANVLKSEKAISVSLKIIDIFVKLRQEHLELKEILLSIQKLDKKITAQGYDLKMHDGEIETLFELIKEITEAKNKPLKREPIGFRTKAMLKNNPEMSIKKTKPSKK
jgi:phage regulator Rha-like protein